MTNNKLTKYAELLVDVGVNINEGKRLFISATTDALPLVREVTRVAYERGAAEVVTKLSDDTLSRLHAENRSAEELATVHPWIVEERMHYSDEHAGFLSIISSSPELLKGIDPMKLREMQIANGKALKDFSARVQSDFHSWCVAGYPSVEWAKLVYPDETEEVAFEKLLDLILYTVRADQEDAVKVWEEHDKTLHEKVDILNDANLKSIRFVSEGTDLTIGLPEGYLFAGASSVDATGRSFMANMPTEEVFTAPDRNNVNGYVSNTLPLSHGGNIVDNFKLTFKDGKVVDFEAEVGYEILENILETDEGARYLGEVALVPYDSPISNTNTLFYNTLFDENASCHIALGSAYAFNVKNGKEKSREELSEIGINDSITHVDFMIGGSDTDIIGLTKDGEEIQIFKDGDWSI
ncbi:aminopeptidase [Nosocomiicoccus massiliensis]|uniref:aminopeptidase n=1 Tax=Nosocomiicoccus massiliensis TaxID=1232430 RepID=UPI0003F629FF|nr:aminopeptidase [Nosocomiicoccus massiliensis]